MMAIRQYTNAELRALRDSPLVQKPENLPAIEQWIEYVYADKDSREKLRIPHSESSQQQVHNTTTSSSAAGGPGGRRQPHSKSAAAGDASPMGNFGAGVRPSLMPRTNVSKSGEDISLGPPRTMFPSSRNTAKLADFDKGDAALGDEQDVPKSRFFGDRPNRKSMNEKEGRDNRESWTSARERRNQGGDDDTREGGRYNRRDRDQDGERRNGFGEKNDSRWGERRQNGEKHGGGWRDRDRDRRDKDWERGAPVEKEPEWMDDPAPPSAEDDLRTMGMPKNQEQFQKWKEAMSGKRNLSDEKENTPEEAIPAAKEVPPGKAIAPLKLEGVVDKPFGGWGEAKPAPSTMDGTSTTTKSVPPKGKASRFASMFKESQTKEEMTPAEDTPPQLPGTNANGSAEDEAGFKRILQMLGGTGIAPSAPPEGPSSPPGRNVSNGTKQKSRFTGFFDQAAKSPERIQSPPDTIFKPNSGDMFSGARGMPEDPSMMFGGQLHHVQSNEQSARNIMPGNGPPNEQPMNGNREQQGAPGPGRGNDIFVDQQPPSRGAATPDVNIQNLLASQRAQKPQGQDKNSEFLLNLLQTKGGSRPTSQQTRPDNNFSLWLDQPPEPHAPKPRVPAPPTGYIDDQLLRNAPSDLPRQEQGGMPERRTSQRAPPGFFDEQSLFLQHQQQQQQQQGGPMQPRRTFTEPPQGHPQQHSRRITGHHPPPPPPLQQMQIPPQHQQFAGQPPPDFLHSPLSPTGGPPQQAPPPGFNPHMPRHPPGFHNIPNIFQAPQQQQPSGQQPQQGGRGDYPGANNGPGSGMQSPPNAPPGFFQGPPPQGMPGPPGPPPGFMGTRAPNEGVRGGVAGRGYDGYEGMGGGRR